LELLDPRRFHVEAIRPFRHRSRFPRALLSSIIAGVQIATTQPIRIDDAAVFNNEWTGIEETLLHSNNRDRIATDLQLNS
jgi:hypothetical protein